MKKKLKDERYSGFILVFTKKDMRVYGGFLKNREFVCAKTKKEAFRKLKKFIHNLPINVRNMYKQRGNLMRELEGL